MTQQTFQEDVRKSNRGPARQEERAYLSDADNMTEDHHRQGRMAAEFPQGGDYDQQEYKRKPALVRSKTFDNSMLTQVQIDGDSKMERKKSHYSQLSKNNSQFHKIFKEISKEEQLRQSYTCALQKDILYQGRMFVSDHWICFHSKVFGKDTKIAIPVMSVTNIKKTKTAILVPNALVIATGDDKYVFVSFLTRENTYKFLMSICFHLEEKSPSSSPILSAEQSFRSQRSPMTPRFPLANFSDLEGPLRQRRQEIEESSSSDSQAPDYDKLAEFPVPPFLDVLKHTDNAAPSGEQLKSKKQLQTQQSSDSTLHKGLEVVKEKRAMKVTSLNNLLVIYMFLVCILVLSSCYLAFKILSLERKLTKLGSMTEFSRHENGFSFRSADVNTEVFSDLLTINLLKLEKVQKNLQKLLEEAT